jgi:hypothetical protein
MKEPRSLERDREMVLARLKRLLRGLACSAMLIAGCGGSSECTATTSDPKDETIKVVDNESNAQAFSQCQAGDCAHLCESALVSRSTGGPVIVDRCQRLTNDASVDSGEGEDGGASSTTITIQVSYRTSTFCGS